MEFSPNSLGIGMVLSDNSGVASVIRFGDAQTDPGSEILKGVLRQTCGVGVLQVLLPRPIHYTTIKKCSISQVVRGVSWWPKNMLMWEKVD